MKIDHSIAGILFLFLAACSSDVEEATASAPKVSYVTTETFDEEVLKSDVPVLVDFTAVWCVPCKVVDPIIMSLYPEMYGRAKVFKLDIDDDPEIYERLGVNGVPHILLFKDGVEQERIISPQPREIYVQYLEALIEDRSTLDVSLQLIEEDEFRRHFILSRRVEDLHPALRKKANLLSAPLENGQTPLSLILDTPSVKQNDQIELALASGAVASTRDLVGLGQCDEFVAALKDDPEAVNRPDPDGATPLYIAVTREHRLGERSCLRTLLDAGANPGAFTSQRFNLGRMVLVSRDTALVAEFLDRGLDPNHSDVNGWNLVHWAAYYGIPEMVSLLIDREVDSTAINLQGETPADLVRESRDRLAKALEDGIDSYGREVSADYAESLKERLASKDEILSILGV